MILLNRTNRFEVQKLPAAAQWAPVFGVHLADLDGYGRCEVLLAQNFFATRSGIPRLDAGRGLMLRQPPGSTAFVTVPSTTSGIEAYGEQRGSALADFDQDGRVDFILTQNGAPTKACQNRQGSAGVRIRLVGPTGNPEGIGAILETSGSNGQRIVREIRALG